MSERFVIWAASIVVAVPAWLLIGDWKTVCGVVCLIISHEIWGIEPTNGDEPRSPTPKPESRP